MFIDDKKYSNIEKCYLGVLSLIPILWIFQYIYPIIPERPAISFTYSFLLSILIVLNWIDKRKHKSNFGGKIIIYIFFLYNIFLQIYAIIHAELPDYKIQILSSVPAYLLILSVIEFQEVNLLAKTINIITRWIAPVLSVIIIYSAFYKDGIRESYSIYLSILPFMMYLFGYEKKRYLLSYALIIFVIFTKMTDSRAMTLYFILSFLICVSIKYFAFWICKIIPRFIFVTTILLFLAAAAGMFNVLNMANTKEGKDTRSHLFVEVTNHLEKNNAFLFGTPGEGYLSELVDVVQNAERYDGSGHLFKYGRLKTEAGLPNFLLCGGIINIILLLLLFGWISLILPYHANNKLCLCCISIAALQFPYMFIDGVWTYYYLTLMFCLLLAIGANPQLLKKNDLTIMLFLKLHFK